MNHKLNTYWNENGKYQNNYNRLYKKLVPVMGKPSTPEGCILRAVSKIYYR